MGRLFQIALRNLFDHPLRTTLLGVGYFFVTFLVVMQIATTRGVQTTMLRATTTISTGHVNVAGFYKISPSVASAAITDYAAVEAAIREALPNVAFMTNRAVGSFDRVVSVSSSLQNALIGVDIDREQQMRSVLKLVAGSFDGMREPGTAMLFERQATDLGVGVGDALVVTATTARGVRNTVDVRVAAIVDDLGILSAFQTFLHIDTLRDLYQLTDTTSGTFYVYLDDRDNADAAEATLREALAAKGYALMEPESKPSWRKRQTVEREDWTGQKLDVTTWRDEVADLVPIVDGINLFGGVMAFVLMSIILAGVIITLLMAVRERTPEIGTLRAIGMSKARVLAMIVLEAMVLAVLFAALGAAAGALTVTLLNDAGLVIPNEAAQIFLMSEVLVLDIDAGSLAVLLGLIVGVTALAALFPAFRAAQIEPATAMRHAG